MLPFDHGHILAKYHMATPELSQKAIQASLARAREWENVDINDRISALLKAADLASGKYRQDLNAATMLGQGSYTYSDPIISRINPFLQAKL